MDQRVEAEARSVQAVADRGIVGRRVLVEDRQHRRVRADVQRVERFDAGGIELGNGHRRARGVSELEVGEGALAQIKTGNDAHDRLFTRVAAAFVVEEEEEPVFDDRAAEARAKDVADQLRTRHSFGADICLAGLHR